MTKTSNVDEHVLFITPTDLQKNMFRRLLRSDTVDSIIRGPSARSLALITKLVKISNSPLLIKATAEKDEMDNYEDLDESALHEASQLLPSDSRKDNVSSSGKVFN